MTGRPPVSETIRFFAKIKKQGKCWIWTGSIVRGYGQFRRDRKHGHKMVKPHRWSYEYFIGRIPRGHDVLHRCDNPICVRPKHLYSGTDVENQRERRGKEKGLRIFSRRKGIYIWKRKVA